MLFNDNRKRAMAIVDRYCQETGIDNFLRDYIEFKIPESIPNELIHDYHPISDEFIKPEERNVAIGRSALRDIAIYHCGFALIDKVFARKLAEYIGNSKCLEIMAGLGSLSFALREQGVNVITTDNKDPSWNHCFDREAREWCDVQQMDCIEAIEKYGDDVDYVICCWPPMRSADLEIQICQSCKKHNCKIIYIGEDEDGCTSSCEFFNRVTSISSIGIKKWIGLFDFCEIYKVD